MKQHYIEFLYPGSFFAESGTEAVHTRVAPKNIPERVAGYRFFSCEEVALDNEILKGKAKDYTPWHYFGKKYLPEDIATEFGKDSILYSNIVDNGYEAAVKTKFGNFYPLKNGETVEAGE